MNTGNGNGLAKGGAAILFYGFADDTVGNHNNLQVYGLIHVELTMALQHFFI